MLNFFSVFEILLRVTEGCTWQDAFLKVLPERKNAQPIIQSVEEKLHAAKPLNVNNTMLIDENKEESDNKPI